MLADLLEHAWNRRDPEGVAALFTSDGVRHELAIPGARLVGPREIARHVRAYLEAVPDCRLEVRSASDDGRRMVIEWTFRGTHVADLPGLPARGEALELAGVSVCDVSGGLIREERVYWDAATLFAAAGVLDDRS